MLQLHLKKYYCNIGKMLVATTQKGRAEGFGPLSRLPVAETTAIDGAHHHRERTRR